MTITIDLPEDVLVAAIKRLPAAKRKRVINAIQSDPMDQPIRLATLDWEDFPTLEEVVDKIKATPPNPKMIRSAQGSLADALRNAPEDPNFNLEEWERHWSAFEEELKATTIANDIAEGQR